MTKLIGIGSTNPIKIAATEAIFQQAFPAAKFIYRQVASDVPEQPWGDEQTRQGALNRAKRVLIETQADLGVGLEGGLQETPEGIMTCAWCVIVDRSEKLGYGGGVHILLPDQVTKLLKQHGELGPAMDQLIQESDTKRKQGAVGILTNGLSNRQTAYEQLVAMAIAPFVTTFYDRDVAK